MFGGSRRHRPPAQPTHATPANSNATTAAASAFMSASQQGPNKSLSSAAAAAALKARPHPPTNVAEVQTKRTARRSASISSRASTGNLSPRPPMSPRPPSRGGSLERRPSSAGSMTDRTFRAMSPTERSSASPVPSSSSMPPVPQIPQHHLRNSSVGTGMQNFQTASQKMEKNKPSYYTQPAGDTRNVRMSDAPLGRINSQSSQHSRMRDVSNNLPRSGSRSSSINHNFSRPPNLHTHPTPSTHEPHVNIPQNPANIPKTPERRKTGLQSPPSTGTRDAHTLVFDPNTRRMVSQSSLAAETEQRAQEAAEKQARPKKSKVGRQPSNRTSQGSPAPAQAARVFSLSGTQKPSPVPEDDKPREDGAAPDTTGGMPSQTVQETLDAVPTRQVFFEDPRPKDTQLQDAGTIENSAQDTAQQNSFTFDNLPHPSRVESEQDPVRAAHRYGEASAAQAELAEVVTSEPKELRPSYENKPVLQLARNDSRVSRSNSNSPARQARFAAAPENLVVRHAPLPRSASPIKSALKRTGPSSRDASPSEFGSDPSRSGATSPQQGEAAPLPRKKSVRVSFDDQNTKVVGESAPAADDDSPAPPSPQQARRPWYSNLGRNKKKDFELADDEVMKPRPALPSFGSVRDKKQREPEERPLVRPLESTNSPGSPSSPELRPQSSSTLADSDFAEEVQVGQSSDHAIASVISQDQASRNEANISRFREPLPPVVTSLEGSGYVSDSLLSTDSEEEQQIGSDAEGVHSTQPTQMTEPDLEDPEDGITVENSKVKAIDFASDNSNPETNRDAQIPAISVIQPSPMAKENNSVSSHNGASSSPRHQFFDVPGGFPNDDSEHTRDDFADAKEPVIGHSEAEGAIFEPEAILQPQQTGSLPQTTLATTPQVPEIQASEEHTTDDSDASIYSDAYEDLSEADEGGFLSLDAIAESPATSHTGPSQLSELPGDIPEERPSNRQSKMRTSSLPQQTPQDPDDWEQVKTFWRSLSMDKRRQLQQEATEDAGAEGDNEGVATVVRRNSSRKKKAVQSPEIRRQEVDRQAQSGLVAPAPVQPRDPRRIYSIQPGSKATHDPSDISPRQSRFRTSMRGDGQPPRITHNQTSTGMRMTMRSSTGDQPSDRRLPSRHSLQGPHAPFGGPPAGPQAVAGWRYESGNVPRQASRYSLPAQSTNPRLTRRDSDASDSSFQRSRPVPREGQGFRRTTMRQHPDPTHDTMRGSGRFSLRSLSPPGSPFRRNSNGSAGSGPPSGMMQRSFRSNSDSAPHDKRSSIHLPGFGRSSRPSSSHRPKKMSRFNDSSDDDDAPASASGFRSRFDNSSDEETPRPASSRAGPLSQGTLRSAAPASGGFRRSSNRRKATMRRTTTPVLEVDEEDSEELPDSDDDVPDSKNPLMTADAVTDPRDGFARTSSALGTSALSRSGSGRNRIGTSDTITASSPKSRGSWMDNLLRRPKHSEKHNRKIGRSDVKESAARRDTKLERDAGTLKGLRGDGPSSPKLQKRASVQRGDSWPLPEVEDAPKSRPNSAGNLLTRNISAIGTGSLTRPALADRRSMSLTLPATAPQETDDFDNVTVDGTGTGGKKKKKFGTLRRMFKLND
ncbi:hypothetical protein F5Y15DRAFT_225883 [Xylariaceae sp. FL0016]|nr:hypothetical protein F5Y15DRAFT_225883 [Xylariaceae sp. FL0016]